MQNEEQNENSLEKLFKELPKNVQDAISSVAVSEKLQEIAKRNGLHIDEAGIVSDEATMVMLGIENPKDFIDGLENKLKLPREKIIALAKDIDKEIFEPIRESLRKMYEHEEDLVADERRSNLEPETQNDQKKEMTMEELGQKLAEEDAIFRSKTEGVANLPREETIIKDSAPIRTES
ncbi:hypothetical protein KJ828_00590, partial [Patescibacteria group bacterium]|nr:hypothetical protein [Patescibacteria group bacterium]